MERRMSGNVALLPPKTKARLANLIQQRNQAQIVVSGLNTTIEEVVATTRELMDIPDTWTLEDIEKGFIDPAPPPSEPTDPNHE
jgi:hypothetical protein